MTASLEAFLPSVQPHVQGCPESLIIDAIRNACIRFCTGTWLIRENLEPSDIVVDVDDYTIAATAGNETIGLISFLHNKLELPKKTEEELDILDSGWRTADPGVATAVMCPTPDRILLNRVPAETITDGMIVRIATRPTDSTTTINNQLFNDWRKAIKYGALEELLEIPDKGWSDIKQSIWYGKRFNFEIQRGKARARMGNMTKSTVAQTRAWI
jgi:hypothetical protein